MYNSTAAAAAVVAIRAKNVWEVSQTFYRVPPLTYSRVVKGEGAVAPGGAVAHRRVWGREATRDSSQVLQWIVHVM